MIELKHGRIAMIASLGFVATEFVKLPGAVHDVSAIAAHNAAVSSGTVNPDQIISMSLNNRYNNEQYA